MNAFKQAEKRYKLKKSDPNETDWSDVVDFEHLDKPASSSVRRVKLDADSSDVLSRDVEAFAVEGFDGFFFLRGALDLSAQCALAGRCLGEWIEPAFTCNSNLHPHHPSENLSRWLQNDHGLLQKLRWVTLGYHYDWSLRTYRAGWRSRFPPELAALSEALCCGP